MVVNFDLSLHYFANITSEILHHIIKWETGHSQSLYDDILYTHTLP